MVLRYWGSTGVRAEDFASRLSDGGRGIRAADLAAAVKDLGFQAILFEGDRTLLGENIRAGRPVVTLVQLDPGGPAYHYVVVLARANGRVLVHDPAFGPFRVITEERWERAWQAAGRLALLITPAKATTAAPAPPTKPDLPSDLGPCAGLIGPAVDVARGGDLDSAARSLDAAMALCPMSAAARRERAGVEFKRQNWKDAERHASEALTLDNTDSAAARLAATASFIDGDPEGALRYWNRAGEPEVDLVRVEGLDRMAYRSVESGLGLSPGRLLTAGSLDRAQRRAAELPGAVGATVRYEPRGGRAEVVAAVMERPVLPPLRRIALDAGLDAVVRREAGLTVANVTPAGERVDLRCRFEGGRHGAFASGRSPSRFGIVSVEGLWEEQTYAVDAGTLRETRRRAAVGLENWIRHDIAVSVGAGVDRWSGIGTTLSLQGGVEKRWWSDRLASVGHLAIFEPTGSAGLFSSASVVLRARSSARPRPWRVAAELSYDRAGDDAPRGVWPGAGTGRGRDLLLRAHPLLDDGVVTGAAFGPRLARGGFEVERRMASFGPAALGIASFVDTVRVVDLASDEWRRFTDWGFGLRLHLPGRRAALRLDVATRGTSGGARVSAGWVEGW